MIYLAFGDRKMVILEPGNLQKLRAGRLATTPDHNFIFAFAPDHVWLQEEMLKIGADNLTPEDVARLLTEGLKRPDVVDRPFHPTWDAVNVKAGKA